MGRTRRPGNLNVLGHYTYYVPGVADLMILLLFFVIGAVLGNLVTAVFMLVLGSDAAMEYGTLVAYPVMFIPAMIYAGVKSSHNSFNREGVRLDSCHTGRLSTALTAALVVLLTLSLGYCTDAITSVMPPMPEWLEETMKSMTQGNVWLNLLCVGVFAAFFEEWLCRGMVLRGLLGNGVRPVVAIPVSALFFAVIHLNPWQAVPAFLLGCVFGYIYYKTGSIKLTMLMHFTNNSFAVLLGNIDSLSEMESWMDVLPLRWYWLIFAALMLLSVLILKKFVEIPLASEKGGLDKVKPLFETLG